MLVTLGIKGVEEITLRGFQTLQVITSFSYIQNIFLKSTPIRTLERLSTAFTVSGKREIQVQKISKFQNEQIKTA